MSEADRHKSYGTIASMRGDAKNGRAIMSRICFSCHKVSGEGVEYGPELTYVASRLNKEELIESILDPNAKVDVKYVTTNLETKDGEAYTGFVLSETNDSLVIRIAGGENQTLKKSDIAKRETLKQSSMPEGLAGGMSATEFLDLVAYLGKLREPARADK
jgi:putative heme-binding domain-containing protein